MIGFGQIVVHLRNWVHSSSEDYKDRLGFESHDQYWHVNYLQDGKEKEKHVLIPRLVDGCLYHLLTQ